MKLEDEIKQKKFRNEYHKLAVNLIFTNGWFIGLQNQIINRFDITSVQFNILRILRGQHPKPASINMLKERMLDKMSDVSRLVDRLLSKKLVDRKICPNDRRKAEVLITDKGMNLLSEIDKLESEFDSVFKNISEDEAEIINSLMDKMRG
ncbi:MAG: MarR family transcriptional regulator [Bacteroidetes bacterium]|nr:MarR family transcriptional regulator [Bacteroidota bacterium]